MSVREAFARASDPAPSHEAAARHDTYGPATVRVLATLVEMERTGSEGATANEIQMRMAYDGQAPDRSSIARRLTSLHRAGYVADTRLTRDGGRGVRVTVWASTPEGRKWLAS